MSFHATSREVYGFVGYVSTALAFSLYLCWALTPEATLRSLGVTYYPSKWWALAPQAWLCVTLSLASLSYEALNLLFACVPRASLSTITDAAARSVRAPAERRGTPPPCDLPLSRVSRLLFADA
jgi:phosphatidylinositol glycan class P protein